MKKTQFIAISSLLVLFASCKGNPTTAAGDSTGTGAGGARVPGYTSKDTTRHDTTLSNPNPPDTGAHK